MILLPCLLIYLYMQFSPKSRRPFSKLGKAPSQIDFLDRATIKLFSASRRISADSSGSVTMRDIVTAPIIVAAATRARRRASAVPAFPARMSTSLTKPAVAASRAFLSDRESSLPIAASGQPEAGLSRWRIERYAAAAALMVG